MRWEMSLINEWGVILLQIWVVPHLYVGAVINTKFPFCCELTFYLWIFYIKNTVKKSEGRDKIRPSSVDFCPSSKWFVSALRTTQRGQRVQGPIVHGFSQSGSVFGRIPRLRRTLLLSLDSETGTTKYDRPHLANVYYNRQAFSTHRSSYLFLDLLAILWRVLLVKRRVPPHLRSQLCSAGFHTWIKHHSSRYASLSAS